MAVGVQLSRPRSLVARQYSWLKETADSVRPPASWNGRNRHGLHTGPLALSALLCSFERLRRRPPGTLTGEGRADYILQDGRL